MLTLATAAASPHSPVVVVLGLQQDGKAVARARSAVTQHLLHMGESVLAPALSAEDLLCTGNDCLQRLARSFRADRLVGGEILPNDRNYIIRLWMLDVAQEQPSSIEERCTDCTAEQVYERTALGAGKLLDAATVLPGAPVAPVLSPPASLNAAPPEGSPAVPAQSSLPAVAAVPVAPSPVSPAQVQALPPAVPSPVAATAARCTPRFYTFGRGIAVGALSGLAALGLTTAVGLAATDGSVYLPRTAGYPDDITWNNQSQYRAAYALTAVTAAGLGAALIDWRKLTRKTPDKTALCEAPRSKWTFGRGVALGTLGSLLLSGLAASVGLTALDGQTYTGDGASQFKPITYQFHTAYSVGYAASAGLALGLGLAIGLP